MPIINIISKIRGEKSDQNLSLKIPIKKLEISCGKEIKNAINMSIKDFKATLFIENIDISEIQEGFEINKIELKI